jgi:hypothetical protein
MGSASSRLMASLLLHTTVLTRTSPFGLNATKAGGEALASRADTSAAAEASLLAPSMCHPIEHPPRFPVSAVAFQKRRSVQARLSSVCLCSG